VTTALVLDIEGTTSPTSTVHTALFGYVREHLPQWLARNRSRAVGQLLDAVRDGCGRPDAGEGELVAILRGWLDENVKSEPLKVLQGLVCAEGFAAGELHGEFFPDVAPALSRWRSAGHRHYVYSSGSERNQRDWFTYARDGRLDQVVDGYFDLTSAGNKRDPSSYRRIAETIGARPADILFLTDLPAELEAATASGWRVLGVARAGEPQRPVPPWTWIGGFDEVDPLLEAVVVPERGSGAR
jgi:enolase-phosphatase E1